MKNKGISFLYIKLAFIIVLVFSTNICKSERTSEESKTTTLLFGALTGMYHSDVPHGMDKRSLTPSLVLIHNYQLDKLQIFAEARVSDEHSDIERFHIGWALNQNHTIWAGRFHSLLGYWNTQFHHSEYLQPSIHRPGITHFDEHGGILPSHFMGIEYTGQNNLGISTLRYEAGFGTGAVLRDSRIDSPGLFSDNDDNKKTIALRVSFYPDAAEPDVIGLFVSKHQLGAHNSILSDVNQTVVGIFGNYETQSTRWISAFYHVHNDSTMSGKKDFTAGYIHADYRLNPKTTLFGRIENTWNDNNNIYLARFHHYEYKRKLIGVRYDITPRQTIKLEYTHADYEAVESNQYGLEWSIAWP